VECAIFYNGTFRTHSAICIGSSQGATIEPARYGTQSLARSYYHLRNTKMWSTQWLSITPMGKFNNERKLKI
jgi:hypothetical protein